MGVLIALWWIAVASAKDTLLPTPAATLRAIIELARRGLVVDHAVASLFGVAWGYSCAVGVGIPVGLLLGWFPRANRAFGAYVQLFRPSACWRGSRCPSSDSGWATRRRCSSSPSPPKFVDVRFAEGAREKPAWSFETGDDEAKKRGAPALLHRSKLLRFCVQGLEPGGLPMQMKQAVGAKLFASLIAVRSTAGKVKRRIAYSIPMGRIRGRSAGPDHIGLPATDLDLAEKFYVGVLGADVAFKMDREFIRKRVPEKVAELETNPANIFHLSIALGGGPTVEFFIAPAGAPACMVCASNAPKPPDQTHPHLALWVKPGDLKRWRDYLESAGVPTQGPVSLGPPGGASVFFNDPFGNHIELTTLGYLDDAPRAQPDVEKLVYRWDPARLPPAAQRPAA